MRQQLLSRFFSVSPRPTSASASLDGPHDVTDVVWPLHTTGAYTNVRKRLREEAGEIERQDGDVSRNSRWRANFGSDQVGSEGQSQTDAPYTPLEAQVVLLKAKYPDVLLLVEVGYRYRFFAGDALIASRVLGIVAHKDHNFLTASIPTFRLHVHVRRLVEAGHKVGVVRQTETTAIKSNGPNKVGPFSRQLSALYTRATVAAAGGMLATDRPDTSAPQYLICITDHPGPQACTTIAVVAVNTATGDILHGHFDDDMALSQLEAFLLKLCPVEYLLAVPAGSETRKLVRKFTVASKEVRLECVPRDGPDVAIARAEILSLPSFQQEFQSHHESAVPDLVVEALALAMWYLKQFNLETLLSHGAAFRPLFEEREMSLLPSVIRHLEILNNNADGTEKGSLLWFMDHTRTPFGARLFRHWVCHPLCDRHLIEARLDALGEIIDSLENSGLQPREVSTRGCRNTVSQSCKMSYGKASTALLARTLLSLNRMPDIEQGITRILHRTASAAEFVHVLEAILSFSKQLKNMSNHMINDGVAISSCNDVENSPFKSQLLRRLVAAASSSAVISHASNLLSLLNLEAAVAGDKLNLFSSMNDRFPEVSSCHGDLQLAKILTDGLLEDFRKLLKIPGLQYASVSGTSYLIEVPTSQRVPTNWLRVNSTKKVNRYHPPEILESLDKIALAEEHLTAACSRAWELFLADFAVHYADFRAAVNALAGLDCLLALAILSSNQDYARPTFCQESEPSQLIIEAGRHPIVESKLVESYVANDTFLHAEHERCQLITGPNMGGKSCYSRQVALITLMAQVGSYVPAASARLHVVDAIYTRMGASDRIEHGSSTFFEELSETSHILRNASARSLVIVDELGRGTSTHDGVAISYATLHFLVTEVRCLVLFVTHYPEIAGLQSLFPAEIVPFYVSFLMDTGHVGQDSYPAKVSTPGLTFLHKLMPGVAKSSFGLHVAQAAQIPVVCVSRAAALAGNLEMCGTGSDRRMTSDAQKQERRPCDDPGFPHQDPGTEVFSWEGQNICCSSAHSIEDKYAEVFRHLLEMTPALTKGSAADDSAACLVRLQRKKDLVDWVRRRASEVTEKRAKRMTSKMDFRGRKKSFKFKSLNGGGTIAPVSVLQAKVEHVENVEYSYARD